MFSLRPVCLSLCVLSLARLAGAALPALSISPAPPAALRISWPTNFPDWQLTTTANLSPPNWQPVAQTAIASNNALAVFLPLTNKSGYFRLEQTGGACVFQASPPVIASGGTSVLSWCPVAGVTYRVAGVGVVPGGSLSVSPTVTTVYTLTASNGLTVVTNYATVVVNPCGFVNVTNWDATLTFSYALAPSASGYSFHINRQAQVTFRLTRTDLSGDGAQYGFTGTPTGVTSINDRLDDSSSGTTVTTTTVGSGPPSPVLSTFQLFVNCTTYNFAAIVAVDAIDTTISNGRSDSSPRIAITGQVLIFPKPLPTSGSTLSGSELMPVVGPFTLPTSDYYTPNDSIANDMWADGVITDATAGTADVSWSITPVP